MFFFVFRFFFVVKISKIRLFKWGVRSMSPNKKIDVTQVDGATPVIFPSSHNQVLGEEILERFAAVVSWPNQTKQTRRFCRDVYSILFI